MERLSMGTLSPYCWSEWYSLVEEMGTGYSRSPGFTRPSYSYEVYGREVTTKGSINPPPQPGAVIGLA